MPLRDKTEVFSRQKMLTDKTKTSKIIYLKITIHIFTGGINYGI